MLIATLCAGITNREVIREQKLQSRAIQTIVVSFYDSHNYKTNIKEIYKIYCSSAWREIL